MSWIKSHKSLGSFLTPKSSLSTDTNAVNPTDLSNPHSINTDNDTSGRNPLTEDVTSLEYLSDKLTLKKEIDNKGNANNTDDTLTAAEVDIINKNEILKDKELVDFGESDSNTTVKTTGESDEELTEKSTYKLITGTETRSEAIENSHANTFNDLIKFYISVKKRRKNIRVT